MDSTTIIRIVAGLMVIRSASYLSNQLRADDIKRWFSFLGLLQLIAAFGLQSDTHTFYIAAPKSCRQLPAIND